MSGHIRHRSPGSFELRYFLGTDPATGNRKYATATVKGSRKDAENEMRRLLRALDTGEHVDPARLTVRDWFATWLGAVRQEVSPKTHERYGEIVNHFLAPALGNLQLAKLAPVHIQGPTAPWPKAVAVTRSRAGWRRGPAGIFTASFQPRLAAPSSNS